MQSIAVLITVHNRKEKTMDCLSHLFSNDIPAGYKLEVFLTDDACTDGTREAVMQQYPQIHIVNGDGNLFWNRGMYKAWEAAANCKDYDFYFWLNDDTLLYPNAINILLESAELTNLNAIIVGTTETTDKRKVSYGGRNHNGSLIKPNSRLQACISFNGNIVLIPKYAYQIVGKNDFMFRHALGDFDYSLRAYSKGVKSYVAPSILGTCDLHEQLSTWCNPNKKFSQRWKVFRTPLGQNPEEFFVFEKRHKGFIIACFHYCTNHLRVVLPTLWKE